jgi:hypothetical protein
MLNNKRTSIGKGYLKKEEPKTKLTPKDEKV